MAIGIPVRFENSYKNHIRFENGEKNPYRK